MTRPAPRRLIWIVGDAPAARRCAAEILAGLPATAIGWVGRGDAAPPLDVPEIATGHGRQLLGQTLTAGVIDAHAGLDPDDLGAVAGTLAGGAALLLLTPPAKDWLRLPDPGVEPLRSHGLTRADFHRHFRARLLRLLAASPGVEQICLPAAHRQPRPVWHAPHVAQNGERATPTADQQTVIDAIQALAAASDPSSLLITADRGRGKSAALGMAIAALGAEPVRLTAPSRLAAGSVLAHAGQAAPAFTAPELVQPGPGLLLIDEAAALPLGLTARLLANNPRCVLTGTVHGYEGSGRGLMLRLARDLALQPGGLQHLRLTEPIRWPGNDPLETLIDQLLLLSAEPPAIAPDPRTSGTASVHIAPCSPAHLARNEPALHAAFGLLVDGHYQTRPRDLRQLLDDPAMRLWTAAEDGVIVGILAARREGGFDADLTRDIHLGRRRPPGHLIPQSLTFHAGIPAAARLEGLRIQRIAVHPDRQRCGIGQQLVAAARQAARADHLAWLGTSYGATPALLDFWEACGLQVARVGNRLDPASASHAVIMLEALSRYGAELLAQARRRLGVHLPDQLEQALRNLPAALHARLTKNLPQPTAVERAHIDRLDLYAFAHGHRALLDTHGALARCAEEADNARGSAPDPLLAHAIRDPGDMAAMAAAAGASGRREALAALRRQIRQWPEAQHE